jgi:signal transduction histidine kinase
VKIHFFRSLGFYLFLALLLFAFIPLTIFQITTHNRAKSELKQNTRNQIEQAVSTARRLYEEKIEQEKAGLALLARMPALDKEFLSHYFYQYHDIYYRVSLLDSNGSPYYSLVSNFDPQLIIPQPFEERTDLPGPPKKHLPQDDRIQALPIYPIPDGYALPLVGRSEGNYIQADIRLSVFLSQVESLLSLTNQDQFIAADQRRAVIYSRKPEDLNQLIEIPSRRFIHRNASLAVFSRTADGLWFGVKRDYQYLLDSINRSIRLNLSLALGGMLLIFILAYVFVKPLTSPLSQLVKAADGIANGNFDPDISIRHPEEFKILGDRFNRMAGELKTLLEEKSRTQNFIAIGKFASYFAHDIKSPLEGAYLIASELQRNMKPSDHQKENMDELLKGIIRLRDLVSSSLDFSRVSNPRLEVVNLNHLVSGKASEFRKQHSCRIEMNLDPELKPAHLDPRLFSRILDNLISNSREALESQIDGFIRISTQEDNNQIIMSVEDNGTGMDTEQLRKVFEPFYSSKKKGYGFGLAFVQEVVRRHGGRIEVESKPGKGTVISLFLPCRQSAQEK